MAAVTVAGDQLEQRRARRYEPDLVGLNHPGLPFLLIGGLPVCWALGLGYFSFVIAAVPMGLTLLMMRPIRIPKGFGIWFVFLGWTLLSAVTLEPTVNRFLSFGLREMAYVASTIIFLYVYNLPPKYLPTGRVLAVVAGIFIFCAVVGGYLGLFLGEVRFDTPASMLVPRSMLQNSFVNNVLRPPLAQTEDFLGFPINRPAMPFSFTNDWGATLVPATFMAIAAAGRVERGRRAILVLAVLALIPMVISANRGLWIALILGVVYVAARRASAGQLLLAIRLFIVMLVVGLAILISPLGDVAAGRAASSHSYNARGDIYSDVIEAVPESPVFGFGAPLANPNPYRPAIGTHGMFWTALFSQGVPGGILYVAFWVVMTIRTGRRIRNQEQLWLHLAVASSLPTMLYYDHLPAAMPLMMIAAAVVLRDHKLEDQNRRAAVTSTALVPA